MKHLLLTLLILGFGITLVATDPIKPKGVYIEFDLSYPFYDYYKQIEFKQKGFIPGFAIGLGHRSIPISVEYFYQTPITYSYRNNEIVMGFQELGLRYNLNNISYIIPYGVDPYVGAGIIKKKTSFTQYSLDTDASPEVLKNQKESKTDYKLSAGVKMGNRYLRFGIQYDYLPSKFNIPASEGADLIIYNETHMISARVGIRLHALSLINGKKIKCPRFNTKQKRALSF